MTAGFLNQQYPEMLLTDHGTADRWRRFLKAHPQIVAAASAALATWMVLS